MPSVIILPSKLHFYGISVLILTNSFSFSVNLDDNFCQFWYNSSCYKAISTTKKWQEAVDNCAAQGSHLVAMETEKEQSAVVEFLKTKHCKYACLVC